MKNIKLVLVLGILVLFSSCLTLQQKQYNTLITINSENDTIKALLPKIKKLKVYYILGNQEKQVNTHAVKTGFNTYALNIPEGFMIMFRAGYKNYSGAVRCFEIRNGINTNTISMTLNYSKERISKMLFYPPCIMEE